MAYAKEHDVTAREFSGGVVRPILRWGDALLHCACHAVTDFSAPNLSPLVADMFATMYAAGGVGLAAPQIGVDLAVFVFDCPDGEGVRRVGVVCNPVVRIDDTTLETTMEEGCLSFPGARAHCTRAARVTCVGRDEKGARLGILGTGVLARCFLHETDHLHGIVLEERLSEEERGALYHQHFSDKRNFDTTWPVTKVGVGS